MHRSAAEILLGVCQQGDGFVLHVRDGVRDGNHRRGDFVDVRDINVSLE